VGLHQGHDQCTVYTVSPPSWGTGCCGVMSRVGVMSRHVLIREFNIHPCLRCCSVPSCSCLCVRLNLLVWVCARRANGCNCVASQLGLSCSFYVAPCGPDAVAVSCVNVNIFSCEHAWLLVAAGGKVESTVGKGYLYTRTTFRVGGNG
jgi:hypothetical protein